MIKTTHRSIQHKSIFILKDKKSEQSMPENEPKQEKKRNIDDVILGLGEYFEQSSGKKKKVQEQTHQENDGSSETPRTERTTEEQRTEPQTRERMPEGYSAKEKIEALVEGKNVKEAFTLLVELLKQAPGQGNWLGLYPEGGDGIKKEAHKALLREIKYYIQRSDFERVKAKTDEGKPTPWRTNANWNKISKVPTKQRTWETFGNRPGEYGAAWRRLRKWAQEKRVWDEKNGEKDEKQPDERELIKENGGKKDVTPYEIYETARNVGLNVAVGGLYGIGYAIAAPWKGFELALKHIVPYFLEDHKTTQKMMESMFGKEKEKKGKGGKEEKKQTYAQEYEVKLKIKKAEIEYIKGLKDGIIEQKIQDSMTPEEYTALTEERRDELKETTGKRGYENVWRTLRVHWIQEEMWIRDDEEEFREVINNDLHWRDTVTPEEDASFTKMEKTKTDLEDKIKSAREDEKQELNKRLQNVDGQIADIKNRIKIRKDKLRWPPYKRGKKKGGTSAEDFVTTEDETDENENDNNQTP